MTFKEVNEWGYSNGIHSHYQRIPLGGAFFRVECASIYEKLGILPVGVDDDS